MLSGHDGRVGADRLGKSAELVVSLAAVILGIVSVPHDGVLKPVAVERVLARPLRADIHVQVLHAACRASGAGVVVIIHRLVDVHHHKRRIVGNGSSLLPTGVVREERAGILSLGKLEVGCHRCIVRVAELVLAAVGELGAEVQARALALEQEGRIVVQRTGLAGGNELEEIIVVHDRVEVGNCTEKDLLTPVVHANSSVGEPQVLTCVTRSVAQSDHITGLELVGICPAGEPVTLRLWCRGFLSGFECCFESFCLCVEAFIGRGETIYGISCRAESALESVELCACGEVADGVLNSLHEGLEVVPCRALIGDSIRVPHDTVLVGAVIHIARVPF